MIIETAGEDDLAKPRNHEVLKETLKMEEPKRKKPLVILYDAPSDLSEEAVKENIFEQNFSEIICKGFEIRFKTGPRGKSLIICYIYCI